MITIIPARGGSRRIPRKNIKVFGPTGEPIIANAIRIGRDHGKVYVSTDDDEIAHVADDFGANVIRRPAELARNDVGTQEVMQHAVRELKIPDSERVICIYPCTPLMNSGDIVVAQRLWLERWAGISPLSYTLSVASDPLRDIGWFYLGLAGAFASGLRLINHATSLYEVPKERAIDINTPEEWNQAERMYAALHTSVEGAVGW